jgi:hypothetical protein
MSKSILRIINLIVFAVSGGLCLVTVGATVYILLTDGIDNIRGKPEAGWAAGLAIIIYIPIAAMLFGLAFFCRSKYKKYS